MIPKFNESNRMIIESYISHYQIKLGLIPNVYEWNKYTDFDGNGNTVTFEQF